MVIADPDAQPVSRSWLRTLATRCTEPADTVLSLCLVRENDDEPRAALRRASYECLAELLRLAAAARRGNPIGWLPANVCMRKSWFLANDGFTDSLTLPFGEETLLLAAHATRERTAVCLDRAAALTCLRPAAALWLWSTSRLVNPGAVPAAAPAFIACARLPPLGRISSHCSCPWFTLPCALQ